ncbi:MAG TPA: hypothetical protein G4N98_01790 [Thermoflexia bacterium]|nr:hypothetical protein [Thermoflexia bacterium]
MRNYTQLVILCEDRQQEVFARHFLVTCGINRRRIRSLVAPRGLGSGEQYVRQHYPAEVRTYRAKRHHLQIALVVLIDADTYPVTERLRQLEEELQHADLQKRGNGEQIGLFIPKRNIETWIHYLQGETVNEIETYAKLTREGDCKPAVAKLAKNRRQPLPQDAPNALQRACSELSRIL